MRYQRGYYVDAVDIVGLRDAARKVALLPLRAGRLRGLVLQRFDDDASMFGEQTDGVGSQQLIVTERG
jgi:hypothetical protein